MEEGEGEGEDERGEDVGIGLGRGVEESDSGFAKGGVELRGGEKEPECVIEIGLGRGVGGGIGVGEEGVGEERGVCFGGEKDDFGP